MTFLALLEMIRMKQLQAVQPGPFEEIEIEVAPPENELGADSDETEAQAEDAEPDQNTPE